MKEGDVYTILNKAKVPNIPCCSASGDVGDDTYHSTSTDWFTNASLAVKCTHELIPNQHHRLILDDIRDKLETFQCSKEMVYTI
jgi:PhoPQ-activated pathogenicity-related protein